jgi:AhpD family alkylhydroperoxidase
VSQAGALHRLLFRTRNEKETVMKARVDFPKVLMPKAMQALFPIAKAVSNSGLERRLIELVNMRASQLNGCAYCLDMHSKDARAAGETEQRLYLLDAWRETPLYSERERAALAWTEAVTRVADGHVPDDVFAAAREHFSEEELVNLTIAVIAINGWNRLNIAFRPEVGDYRPGMFEQPKAVHAAI